MIHEVARRGVDNGNFSFSDRVVSGVINRLQAAQSQRPSCDQQVRAVFNLIEHIGKQVKAGDYWKEGMEFRTMRGTQADFTDYIAGEIQYTDGTLDTTTSNHNMWADLGRNHSVEVIAGKSKDNAGRVSLALAQELGFDTSRGYTSDSIMSGLFDQGIPNVSGDYSILTPLPNAPIITSPDGDRWKLVLCQRGKLEKRDPTYSIGVIRFPDSQSITPQAITT